MVSDEHKDTVKHSFPRVVVASLQYGSYHYEKFFELVPEAKPLFKNTSAEKQGQMLVAAIGKIVKSLDKPKELEQELITLAKSHINYGLKPEYFAFFGVAFIAMLKKSFGNDWNSALEDAWEALYERISKIMMSIIFVEQY
ncbi:MAG: globin domain-containing protein [Thermonemataceae bacterium]|nr:globin domain-containing protein [Thermonemataceae bacterium]